MAYIFKEPYLCIGSKLSIGRLNAGYTTVEEPDVNLDVYGTTRFRGGIDLTDGSTNFGGPTNRLSGNGSSVFGLRNSALGAGSFAQGQDNYAVGNQSVVFGMGLVASNPSQAAFGQFNVANVASQSSAANLLLVVGDGLDAGNRADALTVSRQGAVFANSLTTNSAITFVGPSYSGPLVQTVGGDGTLRGVAVNGNATTVYGPELQLALTSPNSNLVQQHLVMTSNGTVIHTDATFYGNVAFIGQTYTTQTEVVLTKATKLQCSDPIVQIGYQHPDQIGNVPYDLGLIGQRATGNTAVMWDESRNEWAFIHTLEDGTANCFNNFTYANLHAGVVTIGNLVTSGRVDLRGDLTNINNIAANSVLVSNTFEVHGPAQFDTQLLVNGPSVMNTLFVANQAFFNNGIFPVAPDSFPLGQVDNRFSRVFVDTIDVYDSLNLAGGRQDTFPARIGAFGEANVYLYTTSPAYQDTVGIYFDKGQAQIPYGKSSIVQRYDQWALRTMGTDRLVANTVTGNLTVANDFIVNGNLVAYGQQFRLVNNLGIGGTIQGNTASWSNTTTYGGNLIPQPADTTYIGLANTRFATAYLNTLDLFCAGGNVFSAGSNASTPAYFYSTGPPTSNVTVTMDVRSSTAGRSSLVQDRNSWQLVTNGSCVLAANVFTGNLTAFSDLQVLGNCTSTGQATTVQNQLFNPGTLIANTAVFGNVVTFGNSLYPSQNNSLVFGNSQQRFSAASLNRVDLYDPKPIRAGGQSATNVYVFSDASQPVSLTLDSGGNLQPAAKSGLVQNATSLSITGAGGAPRLSVDSNTGNVSVLNDLTVFGNAAVAGAGMAVNNLTVNSNVYGNSATWIGPSLFQGNLFPTNNTVTLGNATARFQGFLQRADLYDQLPIRAGGPQSTNVYLYSNTIDASQTVSVGFDLSGFPAGKTVLVQNASAFSVVTGGYPRIVANTVTGNVAFTNDVLIYGNLQVAGQSSTFQQDLRLLGHWAGNTAFWANSSVFDGGLFALTPNTWTIGTPATRFSQIHINQANVHNQSGAVQLVVGSSQNANVVVKTDSTVVGQTATISLDKGGLARTVLNQDQNQFFLSQGGVPRMVVNNATGNLQVFGDLTSSGNVMCLGQTVAASSDLAVAGRTVANTLSVNNTSTFAANLTPVGGNVLLGNVNGRFGGAFLGSLDVYGQTPQATVSGPNSVLVSLVANTPDPTQQVTLGFRQGPGSVANINQQANGLNISTGGITRLSLSNTGNVLLTGNSSVLGPSLTVVGNLGLQGVQSRWPLDFNGYTNEKTIALGAGWIGSNGVTQDLVYQAVQSHRFYSNTTPNAAGAQVLAVTTGGTLVAFGNVQPVSDAQYDLGTAQNRWRQAVVGNVFASIDSTFNGAVVGTLAGAPGSVGLASNVRPGNAYAVVQHPSGNTWVNSSTANTYVKLATGNIVGASFSGGNLRVGDGLAPSRNLEVNQDVGVGGVVYASQSSGFPASSSLLAPTSGGWLQLGNVTVGNGSHAKLTLLGQSGLANAATFGGESTVFVSTSATGNLSGSWYTTGFQQAISNVKLIQQSSNVYSLYVNQGGNNLSFTTSACLTNAGFSHSSISVADPGAGIVLPQQVILSGFSIFGNSSGMLNGAVGGQPWLFNGNYIYSTAQNVGIGTTTPVANLDVRGSMNISGQLLSNGFPISSNRLLSNAYVSGSADPSFVASNSGVGCGTSLRVGDYQSPGGVLEIVQNGRLLKVGGIGASVGDLTSNSGSMSFNVANASPNWTFCNLSNYGNVAQKQAVATVMADGSFVQASDRRLKTDIANIDGDLVGRLGQLRPRQYKSTETDDGRTRFGLIAQEVQQVMPEIVHTDDHGMLAINYGAVVPLLLQAFQDLQRQLRNTS